MVKNIKKYFRIIKKVGYVIKEANNIVLILFSHVIVFARIILIKRVAI